MKKNTVIFGFLLTCFILTSWNSSPSWTDYLDPNRYIDKRIEYFGESSYNGDDVLVIYVSGGRYLKIRARQSHLIFENR